MMLSYLCSVTFWRGEEDITIKHTDLAATRYENKKSSSKSVYVEGKKIWVEGRGGSWRGGHGRVRETLRQVMGSPGGRCIHCTWLPHTSLPTLRLLLASGCLLYLRVHPQTSQPLSLHMDKYLMGKLPNNHIHQVLFLPNHVLVIYSDNQALLVTLSKPPSVKNTIPDKLSSRDPKIQVVDLCGGSNVWGSGRSVGGISSSREGSFVLLWRRASPSDIFPWSPHNDQDNVHIYALTGNQMSVVCNHRVEFDPLWVAFSRLHEDVIFSVEQKTSKKGGVIVEWLRLRVEGNAVKCEEGGAGGARVAAPSPATCAVPSPCETRLLLACSDRSVLIHHTTHNLTTTVQAAFVARRCLWWSGGVMVGGEGGQLQAWDPVLAPLRLAPPSDQAPPTPHLDLSTYFKKEPCLEDMVWREEGVMQEGFLHTDGLMLLLLQGGPLVCLRVFIPPCASELSPVVRRGHECGALAKLRAMDWTTHGSQCLALLHQLINTLFSVPLSTEKEQLAEAALGTFLAPPTPLPQATRQAHLPHLHDLCRKFFHLLIRYRRLDKALCLAIDVGHQDLFMDVHYAARTLGNLSLAQEALQHAHNVDSSCGSCCSDASCSGCSSRSGSDSDSVSEAEEHCRGGTDDTTGRIGAPLDLYGSPAPRLAPPLPTVARQPPLPDITQHQYIHAERPYHSEWPPQQPPYRPVYSMRPHSYYPRQPRPPPAAHNPLPLLKEPRPPPPPPPPSKTHPPEKNKVKFSDTVTVAVVPQEIPRKERRPVRSGTSGGGPPDWRKELADSLPLCHPNHDYLKDFTPHPVAHNPEQKQEKVSKIKVVHFGVV